MPDPRPISPLAAPQLPALLALIRLPDGSALARAMPAWALSPTGKIDFRNEDDMLDLLEAACDDIAAKAPELDLDSASVYGFVQGSRKIAVATLSPEPLEWHEAKRVMESFGDARQPSNLLCVPSIEPGTYPLPRDRALRLIPGLEAALTELDFIGQSRHHMKGRGVGHQEPSEEYQNKVIREAGLARMRDQLNFEREQRLAALKERRELIQQLNALDRSKAPLAIFVAEMSYAIEGIDTMDTLYMTHAFAIPLSHLTGKDGSLPDRIRPEGLPKIAALALDKAQDAWGQFPNAQQSCELPASAECLVIDQRLVVAIPVDQIGYPVFQNDSSISQAQPQAALRKAAWIAGLTDRLALSSTLRLNGPRASRALGAALAKDEGFWAEVGAIDLELATPAASAQAKRPAAAAL